MRCDLVPHGTFVFAHVAGVGAVRVGTVRTRDRQHRAHRGASPHLIGNIVRTTIKNRVRGFHDGRHRRTVRKHPHAPVQAIAGGATHNPHSTFCVVVPALDYFRALG